MDKYVPPYDITEEMLELTSEITEELGKLSNVNDLERLPRLRRVNQYYNLTKENSRYEMVFEDIKMDLAKAKTIVEQMNF